MIWDRIVIFKGPFHPSCGLTIEMALNYQLKFTFKVVGILNWVFYSLSKLHFLGKVGFHQLLCVLLLVRLQPTVGFAWNLAFDIVP